MSDEIKKMADQLEQDLITAEKLLQELKDFLHVEDDEVDSMPKSPGQ